jgi:preprotein translocase subunit SecE
MKKIREWYEKVRTFFKEVKIEVKKVTWPNRDEVTNYTIVVIFIVILISVFIGVIDKIFGLFLEMFLRI